MSTYEARLADAEAEIARCNAESRSRRERLAEAEARIRNALDALNDDDADGAHLILYEWVRQRDKP